VRFLAGGPERLQRVAVVTGSASDLIHEARDQGMDAFVSGEGPHHSYFDAMEGGINVYYGGHYATEVWGVRALGEHLRVRFGLSWEFLDHPTGF
jgi:putative NIF3 family GTP cyclohydrolase 1 type 2